MHQKVKSIQYVCCLIFYLVELFKESVLTTFDNEWDVVPAGRVKVVHSNGAVCKFEIDIESSKYTGVLKNGRKTGIRCAYLRFLMYKS